MAEWWEIKFRLLDDPMIASCGCDGLSDAYHTLMGLSGMSELGLIDEDFILKALNGSIDARNRYCSLNGAEPLPKVIRNEFGFFFEDDFEEPVIRDTEEVVKYEPEHCFEYENSAYEFAREVGGGEVVKLYYSSRPFDWKTRHDDDEFIGYGVKKDGELL